MFYDCGIPAPSKGARNLRRVTHGFTVIRQRFLHRFGMGSPLSCIPIEFAMEKVHDAFARVSHFNSSFASFIGGFFKRSAQPIKSRFLNFFYFRTSFPPVGRPQIYPIHTNLFKNIFLARWRQPTREQFKN